MKNPTQKIQNQKINEQIEKAKTALTTMYPGQDVEMLIMEHLIKKRGSEIRNTEVENFKKHAISTLGSDHEINFNDAEKGFLQAALADGRTGFKEFIESIPVETPVSEDGTKMTNKGVQKRNLITSLGEVENVSRTLYRDEAFNTSVYPLDVKMGLLSMNGDSSRYTQVLAWNTARLYAELTEAAATATLKAMLGIDMNKTQIAEVGQAVSKYYDNSINFPIAFRV